LLRQEKVAKENATPVCRPCGVSCVARLFRRLRNSRYALKQSSPKSPDQSALLGGAQGGVKQNAKHQLQLSGTLLQDSMCIGANCRWSNNSMTLSKNDIGIKKIRSAKEKI
jgi:hypothetical protein